MAYSQPFGYGKGQLRKGMLNMILRPAILIFASSLTMALPVYAHAQPSEQDMAYQAARQGAILPLGEIIANVRRQVGGSFIGSEFDPDARRYRLKYMRKGSVVVVNVDARTGTVLGMTGD